MRKIVEMRGTYAQSQPEEWTVVAYSSSSSTRLRSFWAGSGRSTDEGENDDFYPYKMPAGFFAKEDLKIDSPAAFSKAELAARAAKVGFDNVDYWLRCRDFSGEPVWGITLKDADNYVVGFVAISGSSGAVLRTAWFRRLVEGGQAVEDTALRER